jgi:hypothetical protein
MKKKRMGWRRFRVVVEVGAKAWQQTCTQTLRHKLLSDHINATQQLVLQSIPACIIC